MALILAVLLAASPADDAPFTAAPKYTAKVTFPLGVLWVKGDKYKLEFTAGPKGMILDDGRSIITTNDRARTITREPSGLTALSGKWAEATEDERLKVRAALAGYAYNPILREWHEIDGKKFAKSDGGKIAGRETELIEAQGMKLWRMKGTHVVLKAEVPGVRYEAGKIEEGIDIADDVFKAPAGYTEKKSESEISDVQSAEALWKRLVR